MATSPTALSSQSGFKELLGARCPEAATTPCLFLFQLTGGEKSIVLTLS